MTQYSTKPYNSFGGNLKVGLDLFNDVWKAKVAVITLVA